MKAKSNGVWPSSVFVFTSAPFSISNLEASLCPIQADQCKGVHPTSLTALTPGPVFKSWLTDRMLPVLAASQIQMSIDFPGKESGSSASTKGSTGFASFVEVDCCDSPHTTSTKAAIVVSRRCFIFSQPE